MPPWYTEEIAQSHIVVGLMAVRWEIADLVADTKRGVDVCGSNIPSHTSDHSLYALIPSKSPVATTLYRIELPPWLSGVQCPLTVPGQRLIPPDAIVIRPPISLASAASDAIERDLPFRRHQTPPWIHAQRERVPSRRVLQHQTAGTNRLHPVVELVFSFARRKGNDIA